MSVRQFNPMGAQTIDPQAAEQREMAKRGQNLNFAANVIANMVQDGRTVERLTPAQLAEYALGIAEQMGAYLERPFDDPIRLAS